VIADRCVIGDRVIIQPNVVIGSDGFSFIPVRNPDGSRGPDTKPVRIHSVGTVIVGDDVEIGAGTTIDRATLRATRIGSGTKIDNLVQIGHNVSIGESCLICGVVGIGGSVTIGDRTIIGGAAGIADHVNVGADVVVGAMAGISRDVPNEVTMFGAPAVPMALYIERQMQIGRLKGLRGQVNDLKDRVAALEKASLAVSQARKE
jgi:UDP-3-O-[3-hydroxymyristoyl] glucosamine N-acyltransferase